MTTLESWPYVVALAVTCACGWRILRDWQRRQTLGRFSALMDPENRRWLDRLALSVATSQTVVGDATETAHTLWPEDPEAARQRLRHACEQVERVSTPRLLEALSILRGLARTVQVLPPPRPLAVAAFRLWQTRGWASLAALGHWLALTGHSRIGVRLWFVKRAFITAARTFTGTATLAIEHGFGRPWYPTLAAATADMKLTQDETVVTAEHILDAFARWQEYRHQQR